MDAVTVWWFPTASGAGDAVDLLVPRHTVHDAAVLSWPRDRARPVVRRPGRIVGDAVLTGALCGLVAGLPLMLPVTGIVVGGSVGLLVAVFTRPALDERVVRSVRRVVEPGRSALVLLSSPLDADATGRVWAAGGTSSGP